MTIITKKVTKKPTKEQLKEANIAWTPANDKKTQKKGKK